MSETATVLPDRLAQLEAITLASGSHNKFEDGACSMEVVSWLAGEGFTDAPACASPVIQRYVIALNDRWDAEKRQSLKPYLPRLVGTGGDGKDALREQIARTFLTTKLLGPWLALAGMDAESDALASLDTTDAASVRATLYKIRDAAWAKRNACYDEIRAKAKAHLEKNPVAAAAAAAAADAAAAAAAAAAADAAAAAAAAAAADADAAAAAAADAAAAAAAAAAADADAAAAAAADAAADADADADADLSYGSDGYWKIRDAAYTAARSYYRDNPTAIMAQIHDLAAKQQPIALELLEALIDPVSA